MSPTVIDRALLEHLAGLCRLHLPADRAAALRDQLQALVEAFGSLAGLAATTTLAETEPTLRLRADVAEPVPPVAQVLANAPQQADGCFVVPRVVDA